MCIAKVLENLHGCMLVIVIMSVPRVVTPYPLSQAISLSLTLILKAVMMVRLLGNFSCFFVGC